MIDFIKFLLFFILACLLFSYEPNISSSLIFAHSLSSSCRHIKVALYDDEVYNHIYNVVHKVKKTIKVTSEVKSAVDEFEALLASIRCDAEGRPAATTAEAEAEPNENGEGEGDYNGEESTGGARGTHDEKQHANRTAAEGATKTDECIEIL